MEEQAPSAPTISFSDIIMNVFAAPADAYEGIRTSPTRASVWVVPLIVLMLLSCCFTWLMFTNEGMKNQFMDTQRTRMEGQVQAGKMSQEQADLALEQMEKSGGMMIAFGIVGAILMISIMFFLAALIFWLIGKFGLKAEGGDTANTWNCMEPHSGLEYWASSSRSCLRLHTVQCMPRPAEHSRC